MGIRVDTSEFDAMITVAPGRLVEAVVPVLHEGGDRIRDRLQSITPVRTGVMRSSAYSRDLPDGVEVGYSELIAPYAGVVNRIHARAPFLEAAVDDEIDRIEADVAAAVEDVAEDL